VILRDRVREIQSVPHRELEKGIERVRAGALGEFLLFLSLACLERGIGCFEDLDAREGRDRLEDVDAPHLGRDG